MNTYNYKRWAIKYLSGPMLTLVVRNANADEHDFFLEEDEELISIATGYEKPISKAPAVASVITAADIRKMGATDLDEVLETVPGLHVARSEQGYRPIYTFRGLYSAFNPQVLMLVNGVPYKALFQGDRHSIWVGYPVENISRIEIIRGPGSAVYGADAFAGVINIITKEGSEVNGVESGLRVGSFNTQEAWVSAGGVVGEVDYLVSLQLEDSDGQREIIETDGQSLFDLLVGSNVSLAPGSVNFGREYYDLAVDLKSEYWRFQASYQKSESQTGAGIAQALDSNGLIGSDRYGLSVSYKQPELADNWQLDITTSFRSTSQEVKQNLTLFPPGSFGPPDLNGNFPPIPFTDGVIGNPEVFERLFYFDASTLFTGWSNHEMRIGAGYYLGDMYRVNETKNFGVDPLNPPNLILPGSPVLDVSDTPFAFITEDDRKNQYLFFQDAWHFSNDWELTYGVRYDHYSDFGSTVNPRLALVWSTSHNLITKFLYGEAFRAPSFVETRNANNPVALGNPNLEPEELKSYELAFDYQYSYQLHIDANLFFYEWDDIILFESSPVIPAGARLAQNAGMQTGYGMEVNIGWKASDKVTLSSNAAWVNAEDERVDADAGNAPELQLYSRLDWQLDHNWNLNIQGNWVMNRQRTLVDIRPQIDNYLIVDSTLHYTPNDSNWELALIVKNLFDQDAREPSPAGDITTGTPAYIPNDLPLAGRAVYGELRFRFDN